MSVKSFKRFACLVRDTTLKGFYEMEKEGLTSRSILRAAAVLSAIQAWLSRI